MNIVAANTQKLPAYGQFSPIDDPNLLGLIVQYIPYEAFTRPVNKTWRAAAGAVLGQIRDLRRVSADLARHFPDGIDWKLFSHNWPIFTCTVNAGGSLPERKLDISNIECTLPRAYKFGHWPPLHEYSVGYSKYADLRNKMTGWLSGKISSQELAQMSDSMSDRVLEMPDRVPAIDRGLVYSVIGRLDWHVLSCRFCREILNSIGLHASPDRDPFIWAILDFMHEFGSWIDWHTVMSWIQLPGQYIVENLHFMDPWIITIYQMPDENFIRDFPSVVDWRYIAKNKIVSRAVVEEFANRVNLAWIEGDDSHTRYWERDWDWFV